MKAYSGLFLIFLALFACDNNRVFEKNNELANKQWLADSAQTFSFTVPDSTASYNVYYNLRNSLSYPFRNIYIKYSLTDSSGNVMKTDLVNGDLFEAVSGKPLGSGLGDVFDHHFPILSDYTFPGKGPFIIELKQYMRRDTLPEIVAVGIRVEHTKTEN